MSRPRYTDLAGSLPATVPFVGPEAQERARGKAFLARLGANENEFGPSPKAVAAMQRAAHEIWMYGDPENHELRKALAAHHRVDPANVIVGEGIDGLLGYLVRLLVGPGDCVVTSDGAYPTFNYHVAGFGGALHKVPYREDREDPEALLEKAREVDAKLIYLANPDNPMGTSVDGPAIERMIANLPQGCVLILDEAYIEFAHPDAVPDIDADDPRVIRFRTFSKAYGMAGSRVGYGIAAEDLITAFNKVRNHFGMCRISQAGALAALEDSDHLDRVTQRVREARARIERIAHTHALTALPSATNFVAIDCGQDGDFARSVLSELVSRGVFVRMPFVAPQDRCIRISCGLPSSLDVFEREFGPALAAAGRS